MANDTAVLPKRVKKPDWLRVKLPVGKKVYRTKRIGR